MSNALHFVEIVRGEYHCTAPCGELAEDVAHHFATVEIESGRRLVEERNVGCGGEGEGERQALAFAARQTPPRMLRAATEPDAAHELVGVDAAVVNGAVVADERADTGARTDTTVLQHDTDARSDVQVFP